MADLKLIDTGEGGDLVLNSANGDLERIDGLQNMVYLSLFGGNIEASTERISNGGEQLFDWWGNNLFFPEQPEFQCNSEFERRLREVPLTSYGRQILQQAAQRDLRFMQNFANVEVVLSIPQPGRLEVAVSVEEPENKESTEFVFIWDSTRFELLKS